MGRFAEWLQSAISERGWDKAELARRASVADVTIGRILSGSRQVGPDVALSIARALGEQPERVFRQAGFLPPLPPEVSEERELVTIIREQPEVVRRVLLSMLRGLSQPRPAPARTDDSDPLLAEIAAIYQQLNPGGRLELHRASKLIEQGAHVAVEEELVA